MNRRTFLQGAAAVSAAAVFHNSARAQGRGDTAASGQLAVPKSGRINVAFALSPNANVIDTAGPWEVFQDAAPEIDGRRRRPFRLYTVAQSVDPLRMTGGLQIIPEYAFHDAPQPQVIVIPAQSGSEDLRAWLRSASAKSDVTMSVCTGAFQLGAAGLLDGLQATTHHEFFDAFETAYPEVELIRGRRFVDNGRIATAGGLTSGFDMALHVVERYFGRNVALQTAQYMEYDHYQRVDTR